jgi:anthranilate phosphoribosyltransferase
MNFAEALQVVKAGESLTRAQARKVFAHAFRQDLDAENLGALLVKLAERGETVEEIAGAAEALRDAMRPFEHDAPYPVDTCGTGGDCLGSFNLSTASALVAAAAGAQVIKHGNRSVSSKCGSADLLEIGGMRLELTPEQALEVFKREGIVFLYAPSFHPAMRFVAPVRNTLGIRTIFNFLGPICNPGGVRRHLLGVSDSERVTDFAQVLRELDFERAYVVHGAGGADELTLAGPNLVERVGLAPDVILDAESLGLPISGVEALEGGNPHKNLYLLHKLLEGEKGPIHDAVCLNAAGALLVAGVSEDAAEAFAMAAEALASGAARIKFGTWTTTTHIVAH